MAVKSTVLALDERFRVLCQSAPIGIFTTDADGLTTYVNRRYEEIFGTSLEETIRGGWISLIHPDDRDAAYQERSRCAREGTEYVHEHRLARPTGEIRWVRGRAAPMFADGGKLLGYVGTVEDITDEKTAAALRTEAEARRRVAQVLLELGRVVSQSPSPTAVAERVIQSARVLLGVETAAVYRHDPASGELVPMAYIGGGIGRHVVFPRGVGAVGLAVKQKAPVATANAFSDARIEIPPDFRARVSGSPYAAALAVPLLIQERVLGAFVVLDRIGRVFDAEEIELARAFADFAAVALESARLHEEAERKRRAAEALAEVGRLITQSLDFGEVSQRIVETVQALLGARSGAVYLLDPGTEDLVLPAYAGEVASLFESGTVFPKGTGVVGVAMRTGKWVAVPDSLEAPDVVLPPELRARVEGSPLRSVVAAPLMVEGRPIGALAVADRVGRVFDANDAELVQAFADQAAIAIRNSQLFTREREARERAEASEGSLRLLFANGPLPMWVFDLETLRFLEVNEAAISHYGYSREEFLGMRITDIRPPEDIPRLLDNLADPSLNRPGIVHPGIWTHRCRDGRLIEAEVTSHTFRFAGRPAALVVAVDVSERKRAEAEAQRHRLESESLAELGRLISQSLEPRDVAARIVDGVRSLIGVTAAALFTPAPAGALTLFARSGEAGPGITLGRPLPPGHAVSGRAFAARRPIATPDLLDDPTIVLTPEMRAGLDGTPFRSFLAVPLLLKDRVLGALALRDRTGRVFTADEIRLVEAFADHAAIALENSHLYETARRDQRDAELQAEIVQTLNASLDLDTVLQRIVEVAREVCASDVASIALAEPGHNAVRFRYRVGWRGDRFATSLVESGKGCGGIVLATGRPFRTDNHLEDPRISRDYADRTRDEGLVAQLVVPISREGRIEGLLYIANRTARSFTDADEQNLSRLADTAMLAIRNAELFAREQVARREAEASEARYRALFDDVPVGLIRTTPSGEILATNRALVALLGYPDRESLLRTNARTLYADPEERQPHIEHLEHKGVVHGLDVRRKRYDGSIIWIRQTIRIVRDDDGKVIAYEGTAEDITERRRAEAALARTTGRLRILHEIDQAIIAARSPEAIAEVALQLLGHVVSCARASATMFDLEGHEATVLATVSADGGGRPHGSLRVFGNIDKLKQDFLTLDAVRTGPYGPDGGDRQRLSVPLVADDEPIGILNLLGPPDGIFTPEDVDIVREVAGPLAVAIRQAHLHESVAAARQRLQALSRRLVEVQEAQRRHLARELHDEVGQLLTGLKLSLGAAGRSAGPALRASLAESRKLVGTLMSRVRELSLDLRPAMLDDLGLVPALVWQLERYTAQTKVRVVFKHTGVEGRRFAPKTETAAYRIVQEALTNVARHAGVAEATVRLWADDKTLTAQIEDRGVGLSRRRQAGQRGHGLPGMIERAALLGGRVVLESPEDGGLCVTAELPVAETAPPAKEQ